MILLTNIADCGNILSVRLWQSIMIIFQALKKRLRENKVECKFTVKKVIRDTKRAAYTVRRYDKMIKEYYFDDWDDTDMNAEYEICKKG